MADLFLDPKVLNYSADKYDLILMTLRWARAMKSKGSPDPMPVLIERALKDIVENRITIAEIMITGLAFAYTQSSRYKVREYVEDGTAPVGIEAENNSPR